MWEGYKSYRKDTMKLLDPLVGCKTLLDAFLKYEKDGIMARIDTSNPPEVFKGATIDKSELAGFKSIKDIVRLGRVASITSDEIKLEKGAVPLPAPPADTLFVDCMADFDGTFYGYQIPEDFKVFDDDQINLGPAIISYNVSCSSAAIAYIESVFADDSEMRNNLLYFGKGDEFTTDHNQFFSQFYYQNKTFAALGAHPPAMQFIMNSRTYLDAPCHHYLGMPGFLWALFGPSQMAKKAAKFVERVESGDFPDCQNSFGCAGRKLPDPNELKIKDKSSLKSNYPPQKKLKPKSKLRLNCCAAVDVIEEKRKVDHQSVKATA